MRRAALRWVIASGAFWYLAVGLPIAVAVTASGPFPIGDTTSYLDYSIFRNSLTPLFLGALRATTGAAFLYVATFLQVAFTFWATARLARALARATSILSPWEGGVSMALSVIPA